jgi:hypothetical protein
LRLLVEKMTTEFNEFRNPARRALFALGGAALLLFHRRKA